MTPQAVFADCRVKPKAFNASIRLPKDVHGRCALPRATMLNPEAFMRHFIATDGESPEFVKLGALINNRLEVDASAVARIRDDKHAETRYAGAGEVPLHCLCREG